MTTTNCGDTCGLIDFTMAVAGDRLLPEERMKLAIEAVTSGKMSQRAAADKYGVAQPTLHRRLIQMNHPTKAQSQPEVLANPEVPANTGKLSPGEIRSRLRQLCRDNGAPSGVAKNSRNGVTSPEARGWLQWAGISIPQELQGKADPFTPSTESHDTNQQRLPANDRLPVIAERPTETDSDDEHPAFADNFNIDAVRERVNHDVQQSDRPADFKRAIQLLTELDRICTDAWYRRHPEPWGHDDWAHVSSEIEALFSIVGQRAEETANAILQRTAAVTIRATTVA